MQCNTDRRNEHQVTTTYGIAQEQTKEEQTNEDWTALTFMPQLISRTWSSFLRRGASCSLLSKIREKRWC